MPAPRFVALPELLNRLGERPELRERAEPLDGPSITWARELAADRGVWLLAGSIVERIDGATQLAQHVVPDRPGRRDRRRPTARSTSSTSTCRARSTGSPPRITPGDEVVVADAGPLRLGLSTCYDLRFPELFRIQLRPGRDGRSPCRRRSRPPTGKDHWEPLLRARAIENQVFVIAPNQRGAATRSCTGTAAR